MSSPLLTMEMLPDELWVAILARLSSSTLAQVSRTSRTFYRLASDPNLWTRVHLESTLLLSGLPHILGRSQNLPLDIDICPGDLTSIASMQAYQTLRAILSRVRRLTLRGAANMFSFDREEGTDPLECLLTSRAPLLEAFTINSRHVNLLVEIPHSLFGGRDGAPLLREISLDRCVVDLSMPVLQNGRMETLILGAGCHLLHTNIDALDSSSLRNLEFYIRPSWATNGLPLVTNLDALENVRIKVREGPDTAAPWSVVQCALHTKGYFEPPSIRVTIVMRCVEEAQDLTLNATSSGVSVVDRRHGRVHFTAAADLQETEAKCGMSTKVPADRTSAMEIGSRQMISKILGHNE